ncbi:MAG: hypothetical protein CMK32_10850 [Porticoccaceae bacterium]|nr:hypothetical protein [Porticoccaceae bacterium]
MQASPEEFQGKRERTRNAIIRAATRLIAEKGLDASSIDDLMATAGMARGTFYNYFQDREEVLHAVIADVQKALVCQVVNLIPPHHTPEKTVACMMYGYLQFCEDHPDIGAALLRIGGFSPWVSEQESAKRGFSPVDQALLSLCANRVSFTTARSYLEGLANTLLCHRLAGRFSDRHVDEMMALSLRGIGVDEEAIQGVILDARTFADTHVSGRVPG